MILVHQLGLPADLAGFRDLADAVVWSSSRTPPAPSEHVQKQTFGADGSFVCFSFHPRQSLHDRRRRHGADELDEIAARLRRLRHHGMDISDLDRHRSEKIVIESYPKIGFNYRLSDIQAAVGVEQLKRLPDILCRRRALAEEYDDALAEVSQFSRRPDPHTSNGMYRPMRSASRSGQAAATP